MWFLSKGDSIFGTYHFRENNSNIIFEKIKAMDFNKIQSIMDLAHYKYYLWNMILYRSCLVVQKSHTRIFLNFKSNHFPLGKDEEVWMDTLVQGKFSTARKTP